MQRCLTKFSRILECGAAQKCVNLVDLVKSFQTSIYFTLLSLFFYYLLFTCKDWRRYSRERVSQSLPKITSSQKLETI